MATLGDIEKAYNKNLVVSSWLASFGKDGTPTDGEICGILHIVHEVGDVLNALLDSGQVVVAQ